MSSVFSYIFSVGVIPSAWHESNVTPVFKKGISSDVSNYRPISIVKQQKLTNLLNHNLITSQQFGFCPNVLPVVLYTTTRLLK